MSKTVTEEWISSEASFSSALAELGKRTAGLPGGALITAARIEQFATSHSGELGPWRIELRYRTSEEVM